MEIDSVMNIGEGSFLGDKHKVIKLLRDSSNVYIFKCLNTETDQMEAVKINKTKLIEPYVAHKEIDIMGLLQHLDPDECNIIKYYGAFSHEEHTCLRFELLDQTLAAYVKEKHKQGLPLPELRPIIQQLATALSHLSSVGIVHGDVSPDNIMLVDRLQTPLRVKLIDFGLSYVMAAADPDGFEQDTWHSSRSYSEAIDMWCLGETTIELAIGIFQYLAEIDYEMLMCKDHEHQRDRYLLLDLIKKTQQQDQDKRIKFKEVLQHPFFTEILPEFKAQNGGS